MTIHRVKPLKHELKKTVLKKVLLRRVLQTVESDAAVRLLQVRLVAFMQRYRVSILRKKASKERRLRQRKTWEEFSAALTDRQFRRYFRMPRECFDSLCKKIVINVGEADFKSEAYLLELTSSHAPPPESVAESRMIRLAKAHSIYTGGIICGEVKVAITLRMLAGGSYLDLGLVFGTGSTYPYAIFRKVILDWICQDWLVDLSGIRYCQDDERMRAVANDFADRSRNLFSGCIGALDGWIVKIKKPSKRDEVKDPKSFYSRKGFYGISVQAIVDSKKRVIFRSIESRGAEHDSTAFKRTGLYKWIMDHWDMLKSKRYFFIGDSAYALRSFLMTPYDNAMHGTAEDNFNFFHSSSRIVVECAFGEIDLRWGILWRPLQFSLFLNCKVIDACMRLHNFIVDFREAQHNSSASTEIDRAVFDDDCRRFLATILESGDEVFDGGVHGGELEIRRNEDFETLQGGRPKRNEADSEKVGKRFRDSIRDEITRQRLVRPQSNWYRINNRVQEL